MFKKITFLILSVSLITKNASALSTSGESAVLINADTRQILFAENENTPMGIASTTKIMTALVALEKGNTTDIVTISENAQNQEGSSIYLRKGEQVMLSDLLYGLMLNSGNDAAVAIAEGIAGDTNEFVRMMNEKAIEIGCKNTHFVNPNGLSDPEHYSTAYDMAIIMACAMENDEFKKIVSTKYHQIETPSAKTYLKNHNKLLWQYEYCTGGKTGYTRAAGRCFVSCADKDGKRTIAVTLSAPDDWNDHIRLHDAGFEKLEKVAICQKNEILCTRNIRGSKVNILAGDTFELALSSGRKKDVSCKIHLDESINEEINFGTVLGFGEIFVGDFRVGTIDLVSGGSARAPLKNVFCETFSHVLRMTLLK